LINEKKDEGLPPLPEKMPKERKRANTAMSFESFQSKFKNLGAAFIKKRQSLESNSDASSPSSPIPADSPTYDTNLIKIRTPVNEEKKLQPPKKKGFGMKKMLKKMFTKKSTASNSLPNAGTTSSKELPDIAEQSDSASEEISVISQQGSDVDYSNPYRSVVYELEKKIADQSVATTNQESESMVTTETEDASNLSSITSTKEESPNQTIPFKDEVTDLGSDEESDLSISDIREPEKPAAPAAKVDISIPTTRSDIILDDLDDTDDESLTTPQPATVAIAPSAELETKKSDDSFNISDLSDESGILSEKQVKTPIVSSNPPKDTANGRQK
jgi:hypothetical protein